MSAMLKRGLESRLSTSTPEGETSRVRVVHGDLAARRIVELDLEVARLREQLAIEREISSAPRRAGRAEALEIFARIDPEVLIERMTELKQDGSGRRHWKRAAMESVLGVSPGNAVQSLTKRMEDVVIDASASLNLAQANLAALERTIQVILSADAERPFDGCMLDPMTPSTTPPAKPGSVT